MKKFNSLLILLLAVSAAITQPTQPNTPAACGANCMTSPNIDICPPGSNAVISVHQGGAYNRGNNGNNLGAGAIWRYRSFAVVSGVTINCEVKIDAIVNAELSNIDDDAANDQAGNSMQTFFSPRIGPDQNLNGTDRRGYVQFTMSFFKNSTGTNNNSNSDFATSVSLDHINYVHYDIDGNDASNVSTGSAGSWFRETGLAKKISASNPSVLANYQTELVAYNYTDPVATNWTGYAGSICEKDGVSRCAQVASSFSYASVQPSITFRMGYDYNAGGNVGKPVRQFGSRLGCFNFPAQITLPVKLLSFTGSLKDNNTQLNWETANEINFDHYEIERSSGNSTSFFSKGSVTAQTGNSSTYKYQYNDALSPIDGNVFYYRLKMIDIDGTYLYSNVIMVRRDQKNIVGINISPNPVYSGELVTVRLNAEKRKTVDIRVFDVSGKAIIRQSYQLNAGINSIPLNHTSLQTGIYTIQVVAEDEILSSKLSVIR